MTQKKHEITEGGTYFIGDGASGVLSVLTGEPVALVGKGTADNEMYEDFYIDCKNQMDLSFMKEEDGKEGKTIPIVGWFYRFVC